MNNLKTNIRTYLHVFVPSGTGLVLYGFLSGLTIALHQVRAIQQYLDIPSEVHIERLVTGSIERLLQSTLGQGATNTLVVGAFWAVVGLFVYIFLRGVAKLMHEIGEDVVERRYLWPRGSDRYKPLELLLERGLFRIGAFLALVFYVFHPLAAVLHGQLFASMSLGGWLATHQVLRLLVWFACGFVVWHGLLVLLRLLALRERLFG